MLGLGRQHGACQDAGLSRVDVLLGEVCSTYGVNGPLVKKTCGLETHSRTS